MRRLYVRWEMYLRRLAECLIGHSQRMLAPRLGAETVEYALVIAGIALATLAAIQAFGNGIAGVFGRLLQRISGIG